MYIYIFGLGWSLTMILLISTSQVGRITDLGLLYWLVIQYLIHLHFLSRLFSPGQQEQGLFPHYHCSPSPSHKAWHTVDGK
jgi:hypothetical protein